MVERLTKTLDRVRKLVALSSSSFEGEARTAAYEACRLIREHGLAITAPAALAARDGDGPVRFVRLRSKYRSWCKECDDPIFVGDWVIWARGHASVHEECHEEGVPWW